MTSLGRYLYDTICNHFSTPTTPSPRQLPAAMTDESSVSGDDPYGYQPSISDVLQVKKTLLEKLPAELIDAVIDAAEYWPHTTSINSPPDQTPFCNNAGTDRENQFIVRKPPRTVYIWLSPNEYYISCEPLL